MRVFICIDISTNRVIVALFRLKPISSSDIIQKLNQAIEKRLPIKPRRELILHTDRNGQFTSQAYKNFLEKQKGFIIPNMSKPNTLKDIVVVERFLKTFKEHKINNRTFQEELINQIDNNSQFKGYRRIFNLYIKSLNKKPNKKSKNKSPEQYDLASSAASTLMAESTYSKAFSERYGLDFRREYVHKFKEQKNSVIRILNEIAVKKSKIVEKTPFDTDDKNSNFTYEDKLVIKIIDERLQDLYALIQSNPQTTRKYVEETVLPLQDIIETIDAKINILLPKRRKDRVILTLRDPY